MNNSEFNQWWTAYATAFPSCRKWIEQLPTGQTPMLRVWARVLQDVSLPDALQVTEMMATDRLEPVGPFDSDRERTAVFIRRAARGLEASRRATERQADEDHQRQRYYQPQAGGRGIASMRELVARLEHLIKSGRTRREARDELDLCDPWDGPRYSCPLCRDTGLVEVWHTLSMKAWVEGLISAALEPDQCRPHCRSMVAPCSCHRGARYIWTESGDPPRHWRAWKCDSVVFDENRYCRVEGSLRDPEEIERFCKWCEQQKARRLEGRQPKQAGLEFDR